MLDDGEDVNDVNDEDDEDDEEEEETVPEEDDDDNEGVPKGQPSKFYKLPTNDELRMLRETEDLFRSNVFKLQVCVFPSLQRSTLTHSHTQIDELLKEVNVPAKKLEKLRSALHRVKEVLDGSSAVQPLTVQEARDYLAEHGEIVLPFDRQEDSSNLKMAYQAPAGVHVVGSFMLEAYVKPALNVDVAIEMPAGLFQPKDHMNYRYHHKRAFYLAVVASVLKEAFDASSDLSFEALNGDVTKPILVLKQHDFANSGFVVRFLPMLAQGVFSADRLGPDRNGVRANFAEEKKGAEIQNKKSDHLTGKKNFSFFLDAAVPTPLYNHSVLEDTAFRSHLALVHSTIKTSTGYASQHF